MSEKISSLLKINKMFQMKTNHFAFLNIERRETINFHSSPRGLHYTVLKQGLSKRGSHQEVFRRWLINSGTKMNNLLAH